MPKSTTRSRIAIVFDEQMQKVECATEGDGVHVHLTTEGVLEVRFRSPDGQFIPLRTEALVTPAPAA